MSSDAALEVALKNLQLNDYVTLSLLTMVGYDYILTFFDEVEYIWTRPWTWVSTLFIVVRYAGLYTFVFGNLVGSSFTPNIEKLCASVTSSLGASQYDNLIPSGAFTGNPEIPLGEIIQIADEWIFLLFLCAADFIMILRVWAMYNQSRLILNILMVSFSVEMISTTLVSAMYSNPKIWIVTRILDTSICSWSWGYPTFTVITSVLQMTHGGIVCVLGTAQFVRQSLQMRRATKRWEINQYMNLLAKQGIFYFVAIFVFNINNALGAMGSIPPGGWGSQISAILGSPLAFILSPRFILTMRKVYACDVQGIRGRSGIDTGFGLSSSHCGEDTTIVFADAEQEMEEMPLEA